MSIHSRTLATALCLPFVMTTGCGDDSSADETDVQDPTDGSFDQVGGNGDGSFSVTLTTAAELTDSSPRQLVVTGRASEILVDATLSSRSDNYWKNYGSPSVTNDADFEIIFFGEEEIRKAVSGEPIYVDLLTEAGVTYSTTFKLAPRFTAYNGDSEIWLEEDITPINSTATDGEDLMLAARVFVDGAERVSAWTDDDVEPDLVTQVDDEEWRIRWTYDAFTILFDYPDPVFFTASTGGADFGKDAVIEIQVVDFQVSDLGSREAFAEPACDGGIIACIESTFDQYIDSDEVGDYGACGDYQANLQCYDAW